MIVSLIVAVSTNNIIGKDNNLIWHLPNDLKFFSKKTSGHFVLMGRKNFESIPEKYRPLPNRTNVVITRNKDLQIENCKVVNSLQEGVNIARDSNEKECFIIGGGEIYRQALEQNLIDKMYITHVQNSFEGDTHFPPINYSHWQIESEIYHPIDSRHQYSFFIKEYRKK